MKVLAVDDDKMLVQSVKLMLEELGHSVDTADNAEEGVRMAADGTYDFVLLDFKMPVNDGIWFMRNSTSLKQTKVLLMTGFVNRGVINQMFELGVVGYIVKPFDQQDLVRHLEFHSTRQSRNDCSAGRQPGRSE